MRLHEPLASPRLGAAKARVSEVALATFLGGPLLRLSAKVGEPKPGGPRPCLREGRSPLALYEVSCCEGIRDEDVEQLGFEGRTKRSFLAGSPDDDYRAVLRHKIAVEVHA